MPRKITESMKYVERTVAALQAIELPTNGLDCLIELDIEYHEKFIIQARKKVNVIRDAVRLAGATVNDCLLIDFELNLKKSKNNKLNLEITRVRSSYFGNNDYPSHTESVAAKLGSLVGLIDIYSDLGKRSPGATLIEGLVDQWGRSYSCWKVLQGKLSSALSFEEAMQVLMDAHGIRWPELWSKFVTKKPVSKQKIIQDFFKVLGKEYVMLKERTLTDYMSKPTKVPEVWTPLALLYGAKVDVVLNRRYGLDNLCPSGTLKSFVLGDKKATLTLSKSAQPDQVFVLPVHCVDGVPGVYVRIVRESLKPVGRKNSGIVAELEDALVKYMKGRAGSKFREPDEDSAHGLVLAVRRLLSLEDRNPLIDVIRIYADNMDFDYVRSCLTAESPVKA